MPVNGPSRQFRRMQWIAIVLVTAAIALNYMDRSTLAIGNLKIREEFGISERWPASSRQRFGSAKWIPCRLGSSCAVAGASRREGVARPE